MSGAALPQELHGRRRYAPWKLSAPNPSAPRGRAQKVGVMEDGNCEALEEVGSHLPGHCAMFWLLKAMDIVVDKALLVDVMDRALAQLQVQAAAGGPL